jgi:hypothetical protein
LKKRQRSAAAVVVWEAVEAVAAVRELAVVTVAVATVMAVTVAAVVTVAVTAVIAGAVENGGGGERGIGRNLAVAVESAGRKRRR